MTRRFNERQGPFGGKYWEDEDGDKIHEREGPFGGRYTEDADGTKVEKRTGPLGGTYWEDDDGNKVNEMTGPFGGKYQIDDKGNKSHYRTGPFGGRWLESESNTPAFPDESNTSQQSTASRRFSIPRVRPSTFTDDGPTQGIVFLLGLVLVVAVIVLFLYIVLPILVGVWLAKFVNRRWVQSVPGRQRWRWAILPAVFAAGALPTNELVATGFGALNCSDPQSSSCARYRRSPLPTVLGIHSWLTQRDLNSDISQQSPISNPESPISEGSGTMNASPDPVASNPVPSGVQLDRAEALRLIERWLATKPRVFSPPFDIDSMEGLVASGPLREDITKANGSVDWLRANDSYYTYQSSRISNVLAENLSGVAPYVRVTIDEISTLHTPKGSKESQSLRPYTYTFA